MKTILQAGLSLFLFIPILTACTGTKLEPISVLSVPEHEFLNPLIDKFEDDYKTTVDIHSACSGDIMRELRSGNFEYDAVFPDNSLWIALGTNGSVLKHQKTIMTTPVVFGITRSLAGRLGWTGNDVYIQDILTAARTDVFSFIMGSPVRSGSGASAYTGFLYSFADSPRPVTMQDLRSKELKNGIRALLTGVERSSGSSLWLKELYLQNDYESMVNYEALILEANQTLTSEGREPMYVIYPADGTVMADATLGFIDRNNPEKEATFLKLQEYLLSEEVQGKITQLGRRPAGGVMKADINSSVFNTEWGVKRKTGTSPVAFPSPELMKQALHLYQSELRKPSLTVFCLDYSGSMRENGGIEELKKAMRIILDQEQARKYMTQAGEDDITVILPFNLQVIDMWIAEGNDQEDLDLLYRNIASLQPRGETDIFTPVITALDILSRVDTLSLYMPAIILMTDGESKKGRSYTHLQRAWETYNIDIPVFSVLYGQAVEEQLQQLSTLTRGRMFNGKTDLTSAMIRAKGYN